MTLTVSEASRAYREKRKAKLQRLAAYEAALVNISEKYPHLDAGHIARQALDTP